MPTVAQHSSLRNKNFSAAYTATASYTVEPVHYFSVSHTSLSFAKSAPASSPRYFAHLAGKDHAPSAACESCHHSHQAVACPIITAAKLDKSTAAAAAGKTAQPATAPPPSSSLSCGPACSPSCATTHSCDPTAATSASGSSSPSSSPLCWACPVRHSRQCGSFFCTGCGAIQPPFTTDHFTLFELPQSFSLDAAQLEARFKGLQRRVHPDRFCTKSEQEQEYSSAHAAILNSSFRTLSDPLSRARYLLSLRAPQLVADDARPSIGMDRLCEIMETREEIADTEDPEHLLRLYRDNDARAAALIVSLSPLFDAENWVAAASVCEELGYYRSIAEELKARIPGHVFEAHGIAPNKN
jgi:molecular chaperone HscB